MKPIYHRIGIKCQILYKWHLQRKIAGVWLICTRNERGRLEGCDSIDDWIQHTSRKRKTGIANGKERKWLYKLKEKRCCSLSHTSENQRCQKVSVFHYIIVAKNFPKINQTFDTEELRRAESPDRITSSSKMSFVVTFLYRKRTNYKSYYMMPNHVA